MSNIKVVSALKKGGVTIVSTKAINTYLCLFRFSRKNSSGDPTFVTVPVILDGHESPACAYFECVSDRVPLVVRDSSGSVSISNPSEYTETPVDDSIVDAIDNFLQDKVLNDIFKTFDWRSKKCHYTSMPWYKNGKRLQNIMTLESILEAAPGVSDYMPMAKSELIPYVESLGFDASNLKVGPSNTFKRDWSHLAQDPECAALVADLRAKWSWKYKTPDDLTDFQKKLADVILFNPKVRFLNVYGPSGNGKTSDIEIICSVYGIPMLSLIGDPGVITDDLMGCLTMETDAQGHTHTVWNKDAPIYKARVKGILLNVAEITEYNQGAKAIFNQLFDDTSTFCAENGKVIAQQSPNFFVVGSFNPGASSELLANSTKSRAAYFFKEKLDVSEFVSVVSSNNDRFCGRKLSTDFYKKLYKWIDYCMNQRNLCSADADINTRDAIEFTTQILTRAYNREDFGFQLYGFTLNKLGDASENSMSTVVSLSKNADVVKMVDDLYKCYDFKIVVESNDAPDFDDLLVAGQEPSNVIASSAGGSSHAAEMQDFSSLFDEDLFSGTEVASNMPESDVASGNSGSSVLCDAPHPVESTTSSDND